jgi:hypothetical protein
MGKMTPSGAKNAIRLALLGIVDPHPNASQIHQIWSFFDSSCAYCGRSLVRGNRDAHIDHLVSTGSGGSNALANFVLACGICNGDEKREEDWKSFLRKKAADGGVYKMRSERIEKWIASCSSTNICDPSVLSVVNREVDQAISAFDVALKRIRELKNRGA